MKKYFPQILILVVMMGFIIPTNNIYAQQQTYQECFEEWGIHEPCAGYDGDPTPKADVSDGDSWYSLLLKLLQPAQWIAGALGWGAVAILKITSWLTYLSGMMLNFVVQYTVVNMKVHLNEISTLNVAWKVIRDIGNIFFIFVLLYASIKTILGMGSDVRKLIVNIVIVAILVNFSLFFTKFIIDISNVVAIAFYDAIAPGALSSDVSIGLSNSLMEPLGAQSIWKLANGFEGEQLLIIGVMGSIVSLIIAFVFFAVAIMFIIRFVVLIFVLILSPIAFIAIALPGLKKYGDQWKDALVGQAFFAPVYFLLTWVVIVIARGMPTNTGNWANVFVGTQSTGGVAQALPPSTSDVGVVVNFIIIIALLIASLTIAKSLANQAPGGVSKLTSWAMGAAGGATLGMAGRFGRGTLGRAGQAVGENEKLKEIAAKGGAGGMAARLALVTGRKTGGASFDLRGSDLGGSLDAGKAGGKGGFAEFRKKKNPEAEAKFAGTLGPSDATKARARKALKGAEEAYSKNSQQYRDAQAEVDRLEGLNKEDKAKRRTEATERRADMLNDDAIIKKERELEVDVKKQEEEITRTVIPELKAEKERELGAMRKEFETAKEAAAARRSEIEARHKEEIKNINEFKSTADQRKELFAKATENSLWAKTQGYNYTAAAQIRKGKSEKDKLAEAAKKVLEEDSEQKTDEGKGKEGESEEKKT